jgi:hypothetical protein
MLLNLPYTKNDDHFEIIYNAIAQSLWPMDDYFENMSCNDKFSEKSTFADHYLKTANVSLKIMTRSLSVVPTD